MDVERAVQEALRLDTAGEFSRAAQIYEEAVLVLADMCAADSSAHEVKSLLVALEKRKNEIRSHLLEELSLQTQKPVNKVQQDKGIAASQVPSLTGSGRIFGLREALTFVREQIILPARFPALYTKKRRFWNACLLYGPRGCGKTLLLEDLVRMLEPLAPTTTVRILRCKKLVTSASEGVQLMQDALKDAARRQRDERTSVLILEDLDFLNEQVVDENKVVHLSGGQKFKACKRRVAAVRSELFHGLRETNNDHFRGLLVLGSTSRPWALDAGLRRRFDKRILCPALDRDEAQDMLTQLVADKRLAAALADEFAELAAGKATTRGVEAICRALSPAFDVSLLDTPAKEVEIPSPTVESCLSIFNEHIVTRDEDDLRAWAKFSW